MNLLVVMAGDNDKISIGVNGIDTRLRITSPLIGSKVNGKVRIAGMAKSRSEVQLTITTTYYKLGTDQKRRKMFKGEGPIQAAQRSVKVKADGQGYWKVETINFRNEGWSTSFKIVARSVTGGNATYVTVVNETRPVIEWD